MSTIVATGAALPGAPIDNAVMQRRFGPDPRWVETFIGTRTRHLGVDLDSGRVTHTVVDLATEAAQTALDRAGLDAVDVDLLVLATASPEHLMPATVNLVADRLGMQEIATYQLQSGCAGAVQALGLAHRLLTGEHRVALVIGADSCVKHIDLQVDTGSLPASELVNYVIFGDGAGAAVLTSDDDLAADLGGARLRYVSSMFVGLGRPPGQTIRWFGAGERSSDEQPLDEDYKAIEVGVPPLAAEMIELLLAETGWSPSSVSHLLPPQLGGRMTEAITRGLRTRFDLGDCVEVSCVAETGNNGNALPFLQLDRLLPLQGQGRALAVAIESSKWLRTGFALEAAA